MTHQTNIVQLLATSSVCVTGGREVDDTVVGGEKPLIDNPNTESTVATSHYLIQMTTDSVDCLLRGEAPAMLRTCV